MQKLLVGLAASACLAAAGAAQAATVTFDDVSVAGANDIQTHVVSDGFDFAGGHFHIINDNSAAEFVDDGTQYLTAEHANNLGQPVNMTQVSGGTFSLNGADIAELWMPGNSLNDFFEVVFTGQVFGGGTLNAAFQLDGVRDGAGGVNDFQHVAFSGWNNLSSVTITGRDAAGAFGDYSVDNLVVNGGGIVPEPGAWALMLIGFAGLGAGLRRRREALA